MSKPLTVQILLVFKEDKMGIVLQVISAVVILVGIAAMFVGNILGGAPIFGIGAVVFALACIYDELKKINKKLDK